MYDLSSHGGIDLTRRSNDVLGDGGSSFDDGGSGLGGELSLLDDSRLDLSLVHHLSDLLDIELFSLSVDNGLDLLLHDGVDVFVDNCTLLDSLYDGGLSTDHTNGGSLSRLDVTGLSGDESLVHTESLVQAESLVHTEVLSSLEVVGDTVVVSVTSVQVLEVDTAVVVSVQRVVVYAAGESLVHAKSLVHAEVLSSLEVVGDTVVVSVASVQVLQIDTTIAVSVQRVVRENTGAGGRGSGLSHTGSENVVLNSRAISSEIGGVDLSVVVSV